MAGGRTDRRWLSRRAARQPSLNAFLTVVYPRLARGHAARA